MPSLGSRPDLSYGDILKEVLRAIHMPDLLVRGLTTPVSPWALLPDEHQSTQSVALAFDPHILQEMLDAFRAPEPKACLVDANSPFRFPQAIYPKLFKATPLDDQVVATNNPRGTVPALSVFDHRKVVEALYEAFMGAFRTNWHCSVLTRYFFEHAHDAFTRNAAL